MLPLLSRSSLNVRACEGSASERRKETVCESKKPITREAADGMERVKKRGVKGGKDKGRMSVDKR